MFQSVVALSEKCSVQWDTIKILCFKRCILQLGSFERSDMEHVASWTFPGNAFRAKGEYKLIELVTWQFFWMDPLQGSTFWVSPAMNAGFDCAN
jgi:hypothetical protein